MNSRERLYRLLPAIYRIRDYELGDPQKQDPQKDRPLEGLLLAIEQELQILEIDIDHLYENWFIETCDEWVVPYIGDLVSIQALYAASSSETIQAKQRPYGIQERRAYIANTIAYRKRKGTASVLELLARDVTGWGAKVVEFWDLLALTQNLNRIRTQNKTVDLRSSTQLDLLGTSFESETAYTIQVRPTRSGNGRYNVSCIGLFIWRLSSYPLQRVTARLVKNSNPQLTGRCYSFSPLENSEIQLFNRPQTQTKRTQLAEEINLPIPLPRSPNFEGYQGENPAFKIFINGQSDPIPPEKVLITTLVKPLKGEEESDEDDWVIPILFGSAKVMIFALSLLIKTGLYQFVPLFVMVYLLRHIVAVDPELGRIVFLDRIRPQRVEVSYAYGFSGDIGGGPYEREDDIPQLPTAASHSFPLTWEIEQANSASANPLAEAIQSWNCSLLAKRTKGIILIRDDATYSGDLEIKIPADRQLIIVAANGHRPHILGNISVQGIAAVDPSKNHNTSEQSKLNLNGLLIEGKLAVEPGNLRWLNLSHCTLVPEQGGLMVDHSPANIGAEDVDCYNSRLKITIIRSICGAIQLTDTIPELEIVDSIIDRGSQIKGFSAIAAPQAQVKIATTTILGSTIAGNLEASDSIFNKQVTVTRRQTGCVRFCYVPDGSQTPPRYQCQPDLTLEEKLDPLPKAIASLAIENRSGHLFAGTAGDGIYRSSNQGKNWFKIKNPQISEQHIISLIAYAEPLAGTITSQETTVTGEDTTFTQVFQVGDAIIANNQIRSITAIQSDTQIIIDRAFEEKLENQLFFLPYRVHGTISSSETTIKGENTTFTQVFQVGDVIIANNQIRTVIDINTNLEQLTIDRAFSPNLPTKTPFFIPIPDRTYIFAGTSSGEVWFSPGRIENWQQINTGSNNTAITDLVTYAPVGTGTISSAKVADNSDRVRIIGNITAFKTELAVGDTITAAEETRTVQEIISDTELKIDRPFPDNLPLDTPFRINQFLAGTAGNGVFRFQQRGQNWHPLNQGLTNLNITALVIGKNGSGKQVMIFALSLFIQRGLYRLGALLLQDYRKNQQIFVGTAGGGVFRFLALRGSGKQVMIFALSLLIQRGLPRLGALLLQDYRWEPVNCGLTDLRVTTIAIDEEGTIFVGTEGGGVFVSTDNGDRWSMIDGSPINLKVTALLAYSQTFEGQLESDGTTITVNEKSVALGLKSGDKIVARGQTRTITKVDQENESVSLTINIKFYPDLPSGEIEFTVKRLIVATAGGGIFTTTSVGSSKQVMIFVLFLLIQRGLYRLALLLQDYLSDSLDQQKTENLSILNISTIVKGINKKQIFAGTSFGSILASQDNGVTWILRDRGLVNVKQKMAFLAQLQPSFTSVNYGDPGYAQLGQACPPEIYTGAKDGSEMGVFSYLKRPQRQQNLETRLDDYLRFGLKAGIFYVN